MSKKKPKPRSISFTADPEEIRRIDAGREAVAAVSGVPMSRAAYVKAAALSYRKHRAYAIAIAAGHGGFSAAEIKNLLDNTEGL